MSDFPKMKDIKFQFADDIAIVYQSIVLAEYEWMLSEHLMTLNIHISIDGDSN